MRNKLILSTIILATACTQHPKVSGEELPIAFVRIKDKAKIIAKLGELCDRYNFEIEDSTSSAVTCGRASQGFAEMLYGTRYGSGVRSRVRFNVITLQSDKNKIVANSWFENQNAYGQTKKTVASGSDIQVVHSILSDATRELESK